MGSHSQTGGSPRKRQRCASYSLQLSDGQSGIWLTSSCIWSVQEQTRGARQMSAGVEEANLFSSICLSTSHGTGMMFSPLGDWPRLPVPPCFPVTTLWGRGVKEVGWNGLCNRKKNPGGGECIYFPRSLMFPVRSLSWALGLMKARPAGYEFPSSGGCQCGGSDRPYLQSVTLMMLAGRRRFPHAHVLNYYDE